ncbi:MAG: hypothetical protein ACKN9T_10630 [Candidatus Methylumidiphilus sp.]
MKKSYSHFTSEDIKSLGVSTIRGALFETLEPIEPSEFLLKTLAINREVPIESEKAKSELLITPILTEIRLMNPKKLTYFSGYQFNVDAKRGLKGFCDFIISKKYNAVFIESPLIAVVEAKHNQDLPDASPQCIAEMYAAQIFNERNGDDTPCIFGVVTNGYEWLFMRLENNQVIIDFDRHTLQNLPRLLGIWQKIIDSFASPVAA